MSFKRPKKKKKPEYEKEFRNTRMYMKLLNASVLLGNVVLASKDPDIGWEDANFTLHETVRKFHWRVFMEERLLTGCLWACNLLDEKGKFWHPGGLTFDQFLDKVLRGRWDFDKFYNLLGPYKGKNKGERRGGKYDK